MPGEGGLIDSAAIVSVLDELGYDGPVALAPNPAQFNGQTRESIISKATAALDALLANVAAAEVAAAEK